MKVDGGILVDFISLFIGQKRHIMNISRRANVVLFTSVEDHLHPRNLVKSSLLQVSVMSSLCTNERC